MVAIEQAAQIRFSTEILKRLGEELNPSPDQGIIELVKNAYDANARWCRIQLIDTDKPGGTVQVIDNGDGMDAFAIRDGWLVLGKSTKAPLKKTRLNRIPVGNKGLGRLAALRMGSRVELRTRPLRQSVEYKVAIDWSEFDSVEHVDEIVLDIRGDTAPKGSRPGTQITIDSLHRRISRVDVRRLARSLLLLTNPFGEERGFKAVLEAPEYSELAELVRLGFFTYADYHLVASLDSSGYASGKVVDWRGRELFTGSHSDIAGQREERTYNCPSTRFELWTFSLGRNSSVNRPFALADLKLWLRAFGGVHIYHNGIRVSPYGNPGNDWLEMNLRRAQIPEERPSTNNSIGRVSLLDLNDRLVQKTDRSGFIENEDFQELRGFAQDALNWMGRRRLEIAERRRAQSKSATARKAAKSRQSLQRTLERAPQSVREDLLRAFSAYDRSRDKELEELRKELQLYRTLSTAGITAATFAHESSGNPLKALVQALRAAERRGKSELGSRYAQVLAKPIESMWKATNALSVLSTVTLRLLDHSKRRIGKVELHKTIGGILETFAPFFEGWGVSVGSEFVDGNPFLRGTEAAVESIVANLLNNSMAAFEQGGTAHRQITVRTSVENGWFTLEVLDNGPGIEGINRRDIWLPGQSTRPNGTGLGLTIVKDTAIDLGGSVGVLTHGDLGGAQFMIRLPIIGV